MFFDFASGAEHGHRRRAQQADRLQHLTDDVGDVTHGVPMRRRHEEHSQLRHRAKPLEDRGGHLRRRLRRVRMLRHRRHVAAPNPTARLGVHDRHDGPDRVGSPPHLGSRYRAAMRTVTATAMVRRAALAVQDAASPVLTGDLDDRPPRRSHRDDIGQGHDISAGVVEIAPVAARARAARSTLTRTGNP